MESISGGVLICKADIEFDISAFQLPLAGSTTKTLTRDQPKKPAFHGLGFQLSILEGASKVAQSPSF